MQRGALKEKIVQVKNFRVYLDSSRIAELPRRKSKKHKWGPFPEYLKSIEAERLTGGAHVRTEFGNLSAAILRALSRGYKDHNVSLFAPMPLLLFAPCSLQLLPTHACARAGRRRSSGLARP